MSTESPSCRPGKRIQTKKKVKGFGKKPTKASKNKILPQLQITKEIAHKSLDATTSEVSVKSESVETLGMPNPTRPYQPNFQLNALSRNLNY